MREFVDQPLSAITFKARMDLALALQKREQRIRSRSLFKQLKEASYVLRMLKWLRRSISVDEALAGRKTEGADVGHDENSLGWRYTKKAILYMKNIAAKHNAEFVIAPIADQHQYEILQKIAREYDLPFVDTRPLMSSPSSWLPRDGHLSPAGARTLAELVSDYIRRHRKEARRILHETLLSA